MSTVNCNSCGKAVSGNYPGFPLTIRAYVECPECVEKAPDYLTALEELVIQIERSNAVDDHGHHLHMLKALHDAQKLLGRPVTNRRDKATVCMVIEEINDSGHNWTLNPKEERRDIDG